MVIRGSACVVDWEGYPDRYVVEAVVLGIAVVVELAVVELSRHHNLDCAEEAFVATEAPSGRQGKNVDCRWAIRNRELPAPVDCHC